MVTTREAAPAVCLNAEWQAKYRHRAQQYLLQNNLDDSSQATHLHQLHLHQNQHPAPHSCPGYGDLISVCVVGRSGVGKGSLINHLLHEHTARVSRFEPDCEERTFHYRGLFSLRELPGYNGLHSAGPPSRRERFSRHFHRSSNGSNGSESHGSHSIGSSHDSDSSHSSGCSNTNDKGRRLELNEFVQTYGIFEPDTKAVIFVMNSRITPDDQKLVNLAVENRKFVIVVCTHADNLVQIEDSSFLRSQLKELEEQVRKDLSLIYNLNIRIFILSIPFPEIQATGAKLDGPDLNVIKQNTQCLHFPLLQAYLSEPKGLFDELQIHGFVKEEVWNTLEPFQNVKKRHQALDFSQHLVAGTLLPIAGPVMVSFIKTLRYALKACSEVGLIEDADDAMEKVSAEVKKHQFSTKIAAKEGLITAVHDSMIHIFGEVVFEIAIGEVVSTAAETVMAEALPMVGPVISATHLPSRFKKITEKLAIKACMLHELWIMQNIIGLLGKA